MQKLYVHIGYVAGLVLFHEWFRPFRAGAGHTNEPGRYRIPPVDQYQSSLDGQHYRSVNSNWLVLLPVHIQAKSCL